MFATVAASSLTGSSGSTVTARAAVTPGRGLSNSLLQWAAFHLLCLLTRSAPDAMARLLGADGFDAGFGLDDGD